MDDFLTSTLKIDVRANDLQAQKQVWSCKFGTSLPRLVSLNHTKLKLSLEHPYEQYCACFSAELQRRELGSKQQGAAAIIQPSGEKSMSQQSAWGPYDPTPHQPTNSRGTYQSTSSPYDPISYQPISRRGTHQSIISLHLVIHQPTSSRGAYQNIISLHHMIQHPTNQPIVEVRIRVLVLLMIQYPTNQSVVEVRIRVLFLST